MADPHRAPPPAPDPGAMSSGRASIDIILMLLRMDDSGTSTALYAKHVCLVRSACAAHARVARWLCHATPIAQSLAFVPIGARATDAGCRRKQPPLAKDVRTAIRSHDRRDVGNAAGEPMIRPRTAEVPLHPPVAAAHHSGSRKARRRA